MEANVYFFAALVSTGIFLLQFILSIFFGNMDTGQRDFAPDFARSGGQGRRLCFA